MYMTIREVCEMFHITQPTLNEWCNQGKLTKIKINRRVLFSKDEVTNLIQVSTGK